MEQDSEKAYTIAMEIAHVERALTLEETTLPAATSESKAPAIKRVQDRHRRLARIIAEGVEPGVAAAMCGYSVSRVSILAADPTFKALVRGYREELDKHFSSVAERLADVAGTSADELLHRLEEAPESFTHEELMSLTKLAADRIGLAPDTGRGNNSSTTINIVGRLEEASRRRAEIINGTAEDVTDADK